MSRIYVDRISPFESASLVIDGYQATIDTGSFATTGSNNFNGNQVVTGSLTVSDTVYDNWDLSAAGLTTINALNNVTGRNGETFASTLNGFAKTGNPELDGLLTLFTQPGQYFSSLSVGPNNFRYALQPSGSSEESTIKLIDDGDTTTTATITSNDFVISSSVDVNGGFKFTQDYPASFGTTVLEQYSPLTLDNGAVYGDVVRQQSNVQVALNGKINGFLTSFRENAVGASNWYSQEWVGPRFSGWEMRPSGSAQESTINLFNADNNGTNVVATITADDVDINGPVTLDQTLKLEAQDPLPTGELGQLAVSGSDLYFHNGTNWIQK